MFAKTKNFFPVIYKRTLPASPYYIFIMKYTEQEILDKIKKFYDAYASLKEKSNMQAQTIERLEKEKAELETKVKDYEKNMIVIWLDYNGMTDSFAKEGINFSIPLL